MMPHNEGKRSRCLPPDVLSNLPNSVIDVILMRVPCKDAVRTSVLSKKWKYHWCRLTKLKLDESLWRAPKDLLYPTVKFTKIIYQFLTHHEGPITKFKLHIPQLETCPKIDNFVYFLSRNGIQNLVLHFPLDEPYKLPSSLFICSQLRHLNLFYCLMHPPSAFKGFDRLISLELRCVKISSEFLGSLISHCPLLEQLVLGMSETSNVIDINAPMLRSFDFTGSITSICLKSVPLLAKVDLHLMDMVYSREAYKFDYAKFFQSCSALEHLVLGFGCSQFFADEAPTRLPYDLNHVKRFRLYGIELMESFKLSCALCLIRSFPYLEFLNIKFWDSYDPDDVQESLEYFSDVTFNHLREVRLEIEGTLPAMQLIKLLLAKSPMLVKMLIYLNRCHDDGTESEILAELSQFWHASPEVKFIVFRL